MTKYSGITTNDWMKYIPEEVQLNELTITGTHDSATFARMSDSTQAIFKAEYVRCQERTISEQLTDGIRYLDLRGYDNGSNRLGLAHGDFCLDYWMDDALNDCRNFLLTNKSETIIICVSIEHGDKARFVQTWESNYGIKNSQYPWYTSGLNAPKLKDLRGKFYLLSKVGSDNQMLLTTNGAAPKWAFNSCDAGSPNPPYHIQDYCNVVTDGKHKSEVVDETMLKAQCSLEKNDFWINHVSCLGYTSFGFLDQVINADGIPTTPRQMAEKLNHGHEQTLQRMPFGRFGIIVMDFYNKYGSFLPRSHIVSNIRFPCDAVPGWFKLVSPFLGNSVLDANNRPTDRPYMNQADNDCTTWKLVHRDADWLVFNVKSSTEQVS